MFYGWVKRREADSTVHMEAGAGLEPPCVEPLSFCAKDHPDVQESKEGRARKALSKS